MGSGLAEARAADRLCSGWSRSACAPAPQTGKTPAAGSEMSRAVVDPYLKIQAALVRRHDRRRQGERRRGRDRRDRARRAGDEDRHRRGAAGVGGRASPDAREKFGVLSEAIDTYMTGLHLTPPEGVKVAFCPMVQKPWLQEARAHRQPVLRQRAC